MQNCKSYTIINGDYVIFKGEISPLSNFYEKKFTDDDVQESRFFNDANTVYKILRSPKAISVKRLARQIRNYDDQTWINVRDKIMYEGLKLKFRDEELNNYLKKCYLNENKPKYFIENSGHHYWGCNIINVVSPINPRQMNGQNKLGNMLNALAKQMFGPR
uniref:DUF1768 domain-containing protein n=1 Tax=Strongyloides papillosus TaxID=174720 RepID=A0A0N5BZM3_STREA